MLRRAFALTSSLVFLLCAAGASAMGAAETPEAEPSEESSAYDRGVELIEAEDFVSARGAFENAVRQDPKNPDALNMLAYSQRKSGQLDQSIETYKRALEIRGRFPQAREYLAEAYLQASLRELATLRSYGQSAARETAALLEALRAATSQLPTPETVGSKQSW
jgi:tetratricopeptide (TPR) repeat protein